MALSAMIFDVDGTLVDTNDAHIEAWRRAFEQEGFTILPDRIASEIGKGGNFLVSSILGEDADRERGESLRQGHTREFIRIAGSKSFKVFSGAQELAQALRDRGLKVAVATSSKQEELEAIGQSAGLDYAQMFDLIVTGDDVTQSKPAADLAVVTAQKLGMPPDQCAMVGDTVYDAETCKRAGVAFIGVRTGPPQDTGARLLSAGARVIYRDVADLLAHLDEAISLL